MKTKVYTIPCRHLAAASYYMAVKDIRYFLNGILIRPVDGCVEIVATNGHHLFRVRATEDVGINTKESVIIGFDADQLADIRKAKNAKENVSFEIKGFEGTMALCKKVSPIDVVDGTYPDYEKVIPNIPANKPVKPLDVPAVNASYLVTAEKVAKIYSPKYRSVRFRYQGLDGPCVIEFPSTTEDVIVVLMPMRV